MFKYLLVPVDGSDVSKKSLKKVAALAKSDGAAVTLVYVSNPLPPWFIRIVRWVMAPLKKSIQKCVMHMQRMYLKKLRLH
ncbi:universal stress protein [Polynucleobacter necessarius]|uniref:universal stress protein n=1 Tax=Polynucleobacter necessarius TaxID=576610 RepID=UPI0022B25A69|nr:universal stress protein [Polynucleobacter necessarius]